MMTMIMDPQELGKETTQKERMWMQRFGWNDDDDADSTSNMEHILVVQNSVFFQQSME